MSDGTPPRRQPHNQPTAIRVRSVRAPGRYADGHGLYLAVELSGSRRWVLRTMVQGKRCDIGPGSARLVSLAQARDEATRLRRMARAGGDPLAERGRGRRTVPTFREAAATVHASHAAGFRNAKLRQPARVAAGFRVDEPNR